MLKGIRIHPGGIGELGGLVWCVALVCDALRVWWVWYSAYVAY